MFNYDILENCDLGIQKNGVKSFYNTDNNFRASEWVRQPIKKMKTYDCPQMTSALKFRNEDGRGSVTDNHIGYMLSNANSVQSNSTNVALYSTGIYKGNGFSVTSENFDRVVALFTARKLITPTWINEKDEYLVPNINDYRYSEFLNDSIIYSLFNNGSEQSSLSNIEYKDEIKRIKNEFFWMSNKQIMEFGSKFSFNTVMSQRFDSERFVYLRLFGENGIYDNLSDNSKDVIDCATNLVKLSFERRESFSSYENQLDNWDAGYAQLKLLWKEHYPEQFKEFRAKYKLLEDKMRPMVYELGFLLK